MPSTTFDWAAWSDNLIRLNDNLIHLSENNITMREARRLVDEAFTARYSNESPDIPMNHDALATWVGRTVKLSDERCAEINEYYMDTYYEVLACPYAKVVCVYPDRRLTVRIKLFSVTDEGTFRSWDRTSVGAGDYELLEEEDDATD